MTKEEIKERIEAYEEIINDPSEDQTTKDFAKKKVAKLKDQIAPGFSTLSGAEEEVEEEEIEEVEEVEEVEEEKPKAKKTAKKTTKKKGRGRPKKRGRPAKRKTTKKTPTVKAKAKKMSKDLGLTIKECEELLEKYSKENKARKERVAKRKRAGKSAELTVTESLEKEVKTVKNKVEDKKTPTTQAQAKSQGSKITELVKAILEGIDKKQDKIKQLNAIIKGLQAEKKRIMSQKGTGSFLVGSMLGGYAGYKLGAIQEQTALKDLFKKEKKLAKDFKDAVRDRKKKDDDYVEFEEIYKKGGVTESQLKRRIAIINEDANTILKDFSQDILSEKHKDFVSLGTIVDNIEAASDLSSDESDAFAYPILEKGGKTPKFKVRKSFYEETIGANEKTGTGEDMRKVYHLQMEDESYGQNYLIDSKTATEEYLEENSPAGYDKGFEVEEEVYVDFTDKDGNKKKRYLVENSPDSVVRTLRDKYNAVSIEDITMEWEMEDKNKDYADYSDYDSL